MIDRRFSDSLQLTPRQVGEADGRANRPPPNQTELSDYERMIVAQGQAAFDEECQVIVAARTDALREHEVQKTAMNQFVAALDKTALKMESAISQAKTKVLNELTAWQDSSHIFGQESINPARVTKHTPVAFKLILVCLFEVSVSAFSFAGVTPGGIISAAMFAIALGFCNSCLPFGVGWLIGKRRFSNPVSWLLLGSALVFVNVFALQKRTLDTLAAGLSVGMVFGIPIDQIGALLAVGFLVLAGVASDFGYTIGKRYNENHSIYKRHQKTTNKYKRVYRRVREVFCKQAESNLTELNSMLENIQTIFSASKSRQQILKESSAAIDEARLKHTEDISKAIQEYRQGVISLRKTPKPRYFEAEAPSLQVQSDLLSAMEIEDTESEQSEEYLRQRINEFQNALWGKKWIEKFDDEVPQPSMYDIGKANA